MDLEPNQIKGRPTEVGVTDSGNKVFHLVTKGGYNVVAEKDGKTSFKILGVGPHKAMAKHFAKIKNPDKEITWTELEKSEEVDPATFEHLIPKYSAITDVLIKALKG